VPGVATFGVAVMVTLAFVQAESQREYVDPGRRFRFSYPAAFGATSSGTNNGFEDRVAAIRFAVFSSSGIGGELEIFPQAMRRQIVQALIPLSVANFCQQIAQEQHLDPQVAAFERLTAQQKSVIAATDRMRNASPRVLQCVVDGTIVTFDKEVAFQADGPRQHVYGAIRFLEGPYATFQIVRAGPAPGSAILSQMAALVKSWSRV
jgi:hypothetical protein